VYDDPSKINTSAPVIEMSVKTGQGMGEWTDLRARCGAAAGCRLTQQSFLAERHSAL